MLTASQKATEIKTLRDKPYEDGDGGALTVNSACLIALDRASDKDTPHQRLRSYRLIRLLQSDGDTDLTADDIVWIKEKVGAIYSPVIVGQVYEVIDPSCMKQQG